MIIGKSIRRYLLLGVVLAIALLVWSARWYLHFSNYTGLIVFPDLKVVRILPDGPSADSGMQIGDRIIAINGRPVNNLTEYLNVVRRPEMIGLEIPVDVHREDGTQRVSMTVNNYPVLHPSLFGPGLGVVLLVFGLYVFFKKHEDPSSGIYLALNTCLFVLLALSNHLLKQPYSSLLFLLWGGSLMLVVPVNLHFYLVFPEARSPVSGRPWLLAGLYVIPLIFLVLLARAAFDIELAVRSGLDCGPAFVRMREIFVIYFVIGFIYLVACVASIVHSFFTAGSPERKKQVQVILIGAMTTLLLAIPAIGGLTFFLTAQEVAALWPSWLFSVLYGLIVLTTVILPFSLALAILKYRLWDVDTAINRSLIYMGVSVALISLYFFIVGVLGWLFGRVARPASHLAVLAFTLTVAFVAEPLRHFVKRLVDRTFNREAYEYRKTLGDFSRELISINRLEDLPRGLCETVSHALGVRNAAVVLKDNTGPAEYRVAASHGLPDPIATLPIQGASFISNTVQEQQGPFASQDLVDTPIDSGRLKGSLKAMEEARASLIVPIRREGESLGWISLGEKKSETLYTSEDRELLETLANQAAVAITNALAFEEIDALNRDLKEKISKVEEQASEILRLQERLLDENRYLKEEISGQYDSTEIIGAGHGLSRMMAVVEKAAQSDATILICGESGTGKELIARAVYRNSHLRDGPFVKVNCAALSEGVLQSELFGHEKGAFTGAHERRIGRFELADGGTIFLDEIGDIPASTQILLLRALQEQEFERVGGTRTIQVRVRVIAATNRDLEEAVAQGHFREDLYYRLKVITIEVPPLRERRADVMELALHFVGKYSQKYGKRILKIDDEVLERFKRYGWPGNVRELENVIERSVVLGRGVSLALEDIPMELQILDPSIGRGRARDAGLAPDGPLTDAIGEIERKRLIEALEEAHGNKSRAARSLGLKRSTFFNKLKKYGLLTN